MAKCRFYVECPNGGVFTRCTSTGYVAECVPLIFQAIEEDDDLYRAALHSRSFMRFIHCTEPRKPIKVKVRRRKR